MKKIVWSEAATHDLRRIRDDLSRLDPAFGQVTIRRLVLAARWLVETPGAGPPVGYRRWRKWRPAKSRHLLIYEPTREGIAVVRVFHATQDWQAVVD